MQHSQEAQVADITADIPADALPLAGVTRPAPTDPESAALQPLVLRTCQALQAMAGSLGALESVLSRMEALEPGTDHHAELLHDAEETVAHVIALLRREGPPYALSPGRLLQVTLVTSGTMTNRIDRLEAKGLVERVPDPNDGRSVQVVLSTAGRGRVDDALTDLLAHERAILAALSPADQDQLADLLRSLTLPFDTAAD